MFINRKYFSITGGLLPPFIFLYSSTRKSYFKKTSHYRYFQEDRPYIRTKLHIDKIIDLIWSAKVPFYWIRPLGKKANGIIQPLIQIKNQYYRRNTLAGHWGHCKIVRIKYTGSRHSVPYPQLRFVEIPCDSTYVIKTIGWHCLGKSLSPVLFFESLIGLSGSKDSPLSPVKIIIADAMACYPPTKQWPTKFPSLPSLVHFIISCASSVF